MSFIAAGALFSPPRSNSSSNLKGHIQSFKYNTALHCSQPFEMLEHRVKGKKKKKKDQIPLQCTYLYNVIYFMSFHKPYMIKFLTVFYFKCYGRERKHVAVIPSAYDEKHFNINYIVLCLWPVLRGPKKAVFPPHPCLVFIFSYPLNLVSGQCTWLKVTSRIYSCV